MNGTFSKMETVKKPKFVVYDQFCWLSPDHIERFFYSKKDALAWYGFLKDVYPKKSLGFTDYENFMKIKNSIKN